MAEAYPAELRERVVKAYEAGEGSYPTVAKKFLACLLPWGSTSATSRSGVASFWTGVDRERAGVREREHQSTLALRARVRSSRIASRSALVRAGDDGRVGLGGEVRGRVRHSGAGRSGSRGASSTTVLVTSGNRVLLRRARARTGDRTLPSGAATLGGRGASTSSATSSSFLPLLTPTGPGPPIRRVNERGEPTQTHETTHKHATPESTRGDTENRRDGSTWRGLP